MGGAAGVTADRAPLSEAVSNLVDNATEWRTPGPGCRVEPRFPAGAMPP